MSGPAVHDVIDQLPPSLRQWPVREGELDEQSRNPAVRHAVVDVWDDCRGHLLYIILHVSPNGEAALRAAVLGGLRDSPRHRELARQGRDGELLDALPEEYLRAHGITSLLCLGASVPFSALEVLDRLDAAEEDTAQGEASDDDRG